MLQYSIAYSLLNAPVAVRRRKNIKKLSLRTILVFMVTLFLCFSLVFVVILNRSKVESLTMEQLILEKSIRIKDVMAKLLYKAQILSSLVLQNDGDVTNFEQIAATIVDDSAILNILIAPDGVVSDVYPLEGNEEVIGLDFFSEGAGNKEAMMAKETGLLVLGGPFEAVQGGQVLAGRLPVFLDGGDGEKRFWGLVSVTLKYPEVLDGAGLNELQIQGFAYEIWRINPDDGEKQIIAGSGNEYNSSTYYIEKQLSIENADWYFRILPVRTWYEFPETWVSILIGICVSLLVAAVVQNNQNLKVLKNKLETLSQTDPLTGIHNRRYFMEAVAKQMNRVIRTGSESYIIMLDLDYFKKINDHYKHQGGDEVLKEITARIAKTLRSYDLFARYGGEEFIVFISEIDKASTMRLAERIRLKITDTPVEIKGASVSVTVSLGIAPAAPVNELEEAIALADKALYKAKEAGRNRSVYWEEASM